MKPTARIIGIASCVIASLLAAAACERSQEPKGYGFVSHVEPVRRPPSENRIEDGSLVVRGEEAKKSWATRPGESLEIEVPSLSSARFEVNAASLDDPQAHVRIDGIRSDGTRERLIETRIRDNDWQQLTVDLSPYAGESLTLVLSHEPSHSDASTLDWGEPLILQSGDEMAPTNVILITLDTTRADSTLDPSVTPHLFALAERGVRFKNAWSAATSTAPSHASLLTGLPVDQHGVVSNRSQLPDELETLAEQLAERGMQTAASVTVDHLGPDAGFAQGFDRFRPAQSGDARDGRRSIEQVLQWLETWSGESARPFFLWIHLFDPHTPYGPPQDFLQGEWAARGFQLPDQHVDPPTMPIFPGPLPKPLSWITGTTHRDYVEALYQAGVAYADSLVGQVLNGIEVMGLASKTLVVVTADHGEALGEQGVFYQHAGLWPASLRVPSIWAGPGWPRGVETESPISGVELAPTILASVIGEPERTRLYQSVMEPDPSHRVWFSESGMTQIGFRDGEVHYIEALAPGQFGVRTEDRSDGPHVTAIQRYRAGRKWLFDIHADPDLERNLARRSGSGLARYRSMVDDRKREFNPPSPKRNLTEREAAELQALGYVD